MDILIKNGLIVDGKGQKAYKGDILIEKGIIQKIAKEINENAKTIIDAKGKIVAPGFIDLHTHLREPGRENAETIESGMKAAVNGGFTTVCPMPNTTPTIQTEADIKFLLGKAREASLINLCPIGAITKERSGQELTEMGDMKNAGCFAVSDDGDSVKDAGLMRRALEYASMLDLLVIVHSEDKEMVQDGVMNEGYWSTKLGLSPMPREAESIIVDRDIRLAELADAKIHIAHVSTAESVEIIREAKKRKAKVTAEVCPHHFSLTDEDLKTYNTNFKVSPPLRTPEDIKAIKEGLKDGTIDAIATDHAPHLDNEKELEFDYAPFGMIGLETALSLSIMKLVDEGVLSIEELIQKMATNPAKIIGINKGILDINKEADITIFDPEKEWVYEKEKIVSKAKNSPYIGQTLKGKVINVIVSGKILMKG